MEATLCCEF